MTLRLLFLGDAELADRYRSACQRVDVEISSIARQHGPTLQDRLNEDCCDAVILDGSREDAFALIEAAAARGKHVLVREPIALAPASCDRLTALRDEHRSVVLMAPWRRFLPSLQEVHASLAAECLGELGLLRVHNWRGGESSQVDLDTQMFANVDLVCWCFGGAPDTVFASRPPAAASGFVQMHFGYSHGGMAIVDDAPAIAGQANYFSLSLIGSQGAAYADDHHNTHLHFKVDGPATLLAHQGDFPLVGQLTKFVECVSGGVSATCESAIQVTRVVEAVQQSLACNDVVSLT